MGANAGDFDEGASRRKTGGARRSFQRFSSSISGRFTDRATPFANQEDDKIAAAVIVHASDKRVAAFDAVNQTVVAQKFERTINCDRRWPGLLVQAIDDFIGAKRAMAGEQYFQHLSPHRREPLGPRGALRLGMSNRGAGAALVIVIRGRKNCGHCNS